MLAHRGAPELFGPLVELAVGLTKSGFTPGSPDQGPNQGSCLYTFSPVGFVLALQLSKLTNGLHMTNVHHVNIKYTDACLFTLAVSK